LQFLKSVCGDFTAELTLQTVKKTCNCCYKRTKYSAVTAKKVMLLAKWRKPKLL